jgi:hypothetical protein
VRAWPLAGFNVGFLFHEARNVCLSEMADLPMVDIHLPDANRIGPRKL